MSLCVRLAPAAHLVTQRSDGILSLSFARRACIHKADPATSLRQGATLMVLSILGIDISKLKFDVALILETGKFRHKVCPNTPAGFAQLSAWLTKHKVERVHACLEATGTYG